MRTRVVTTIRYIVIIRYLLFIMALAMISLPIKADRSTVGAAATEVIQHTGGCNGASFAQPVGSPIGAGTNPLSVAVGDFNLDGKPDLAVANVTSDNVTILLGNGSGGFSEPAGSPVGAGTKPVSVVVGDFNRDGKPDLAVANSRSFNVTILLGNGSGGFTQAAGSPVDVGVLPFCLATGDFNLDGKPDLAVANGASDNVTILLGDGSGGFAQSASSPVSAGTSPRSVAVGDFNLDGKPDLAVVNVQSLNVTILLGNGSGGFTEPAGSPVSAGVAPFSVAVGDFNLDGKPDLVTVDPIFDNVTILLGNGSGAFAQAAGSPVGVGTQPHSVAVGDFNLDGKPDLAVVNNGFPDNNVTILFGNGSGGFTEPAGSPVGAGGNPASVAVGDFNLDGKPDLAVANSSGGSNNVTIQLNTCDAFPCGDIGFMQPAGSPVGAGIHPRSVAVGDFNLDGKPDLAVANEGSHNVTVLLGNGIGGFIPAAGSPVGTGTQPVSLSGGDFNLDGKPDLAVANLFSNNVTILLGNGAGGFTQAAGSPVGAGISPLSVALGDFNLDGKPDLAVANSGSDNVTILLGNGSGGFIGSTVGAGTAPASVASGDFNLDGKPDLAVANNSSNNVTILLGNGSGGFTQLGSSPVGAGNNPVSLAVGDFNTDGKSDLAVANHNPGSMTILLGDGGGGFTQPAGSPVGSGNLPLSVAVGDFNLDGKSDLAVANDLLSNNVTILLGNGSGGFAQPAGSPVGAGFFPFSVAVGDFNIDGKPDLAVANLISDNVTILLNTCQGPGGACALTCPPDVVQVNDPGECGAIVNYPAPQIGEGCGTVTCSPASGSFFPKGTTTVTCKSNNGAGPEMCTFTVTVNDTQPPTITCPANQTAVTNQNACPSPACQVVNYPAPVALDNCPGVGVVCNPPGGSCFPVGVTTVTCTATDASGNTASCSFTVTTFDVALQDDSNPAIILLWNSITGSYRFCCNGTTSTGVGMATRKGCVYTLQHNAGNRRILGRHDKAVHSGSGSLQAPPGSTRCTITDRNTLNDTLLPACQ